MDEQQPRDLRELNSDELLALLHDAEDTTRAYAAALLGERKEVAAVDALIESLKDDESVWSAGAAAAHALGQIGDSRAAEPLIASMNSHFVQGAAIDALGKMRSPQALKPLIKRFAQWPDSGTATILGNWGDPRAVEVLILTMQHPDQRLRFYTARALGKIGDARALPVLEWARDHDTAPITGIGGIRNKSVGIAAAIAIEKITNAMPPENSP